VAVLKTQGTVEFCNQQTDCGLRNRKGNTQGKGKENHKRYYRNRERETNGQEVQCEKTKGSIKEIKLLFKKKRDTLLNKKERKRGKKRKEKNEVKT